ncbi:Cupredoxin [Aspergillus recurvatus]
MGMRVFSNYLLKATSPRRWWQSMHGLAGPICAARRGVSRGPYTTEQRWRKYAIFAPATALLGWSFAQQGKTFSEGPEIPDQRGVDPALTPKAHESAQQHSMAPEDPTHETLQADMSSFPIERAILKTAPEVPPVIKRNYPVVLKVCLETTTKVSQLTASHKYEQWTFNNSVPGPFIRARVGDILELSIKNSDKSGNPHNIDCHAFTGPGGGSALTTVSEGETKTGRFKLLYPGLYIYHCAAAPVPVHIANGMYGLMYVQPENLDNLPAVDREFYVMQSEFYHEPPETDDNGRLSQVVEFSYPNGLREEPDAVVFNGHESALTLDKPLKAKVGETVRIYFGNAGPNLTSSFHIIGGNFNRLYREGDVVTPPAQFVQTTSVPPGGSTIVDMEAMVSGTYALVDHAIFRLDKGAVGYLNVSGKQRPDIYQGMEPPEPCVGCKLHP